MSIRRAALLAVVVAVGIVLAAAVFLYDRGRTPTRGAAREAIRPGVLTEVNEPLPSSTPPNAAAAVTSPTPAAASASAIATEASTARPTAAVQKQERTGSPATAAPTTRAAAAASAGKPGAELGLFSAAPATTATPAARVPPGLTPNAAAGSDLLPLTVVGGRAAPVSHPEAQAVTQHARNGTINWSGVIEPGELITIDGDGASPGAVTGALPGIPVQVELLSRDAAIAEAPGPSNGWRRMVIRSRKRQSAMSIRWTVLR